MNDLASRLRDLGWPVSNATISGMLSGDKRVSISIAELHAFSRALSTSPLYLTLGLPKTESFPKHPVLDAWGDDDCDVYDLAAWAMGSAIPRYNPESKDIAFATEDALIFLERTSRISEFIWHDASKLLALKTMDSLDSTWTSKKQKEVEDNLIESLSRIRTLRRKHARRAEASELAQIKVLPMPAVFGFVDSENSIPDAVASITVLDLTEAVSENRLARARRLLERQHDDEINNSADFAR